MTNLLLRAPDLRLTWKLLLRLKLALWFLLVDQVYAGAYLVTHSGRPGSDAMLYAASTNAWLTGGDPWQITEAGIRFAAPPPTMLLYIPFAYLPDSFNAAFWVIADVVAVTYVIRRLNIEWWWMLFPPIVEATLAGNPEPVMLALLVSGSDLARAAGPLLKVYALAPLLGERRWSAIAGSLLVFLVTAFILPWGRFLDDAPLIAGSMAQQAVGLSAFSVPLLLPVGILGLIALGTRRAGWLAVPVLWPHTQLHYATTALPEMTTLLAFGFSLPVPGAPAAAVAIQALLEHGRQRAIQTSTDASVPSAGHPEAVHAASRHT